MTPLPQEAARFLAHIRAVRHKMLLRSLSTHVLGGATILLPLAGVAIGLGLNVTVTIIVVALGLIAAALMAPRPEAADAARLLDRTYGLGERAAAVREAFAEGKGAAMAVLAARQGERMVASLRPFPEISLWPGTRPLALALGALAAGYILQALVPRVAHQGAPLVTGGETMMHPPARQGEPAPRPRAARSMMEGPRAMGAQAGRPVVPAEGQEAWVEGQEGQGGTGGIALSGQGAGGGRGEGEGQGGGGSLDTHPGARVGALETAGGMVVVLPRERVGPTIAPSEEVGWVPPRYRLGVRRYLLGQNPKERKDGTNAEP